MRFSAVAYTNGNGVMGSDVTEIVELLPPGRIGPNKKYKIEVALDGKNFIDSPSVYMTLDTSQVEDLYDFHSYTADDVKLAKIKYIDQDTKKEIAPSEEIKCYDYFKYSDIRPVAKNIPGYKLVKSPNSDKTYAETPTVYYEYVKDNENTVEELKVKINDTKAVTIGERTKQDNIVVPNKENSSIICNAVNGLKIDENGALVGTPEDVTFEKDSKKATVKLEVLVKNGDEKISKEISVTVNKKDSETVNNKDNEEGSNSSNSPTNSGHRKNTNNKFTISNDINSSNNLIRLAGKDRIDTSIALSQALYPNGADTIVLTNKNKSCDSISALPYIKMLNAPLIYTNDDSTPENVISEIKRLKAKKIVLIGGNSSITKEQEEKLKASGFKVERIAGKDRYATSYMIAKRLMKMTGKNDFILANGNSQIDAISITPMAMDRNVPILLTNGRSFTNDIKDIVYNANSLVLAGGSNSISNELENSIKENKKINVERIHGKDRYETAIKIADKIMPNSINSIYANGNKIEDALVSAQLSVFKKAPIILLNSSGIDESTKDYIKNSKIRKNIFVGGENSISENTIENIYALTK